MTEVDHEYYCWLIGQVRVPPDRSYLDVFERMHNMEFVWMIPNDDNRVQDALDLRTEFLAGRKRIDLSGATCLEVLISLSRRVAFDAGEAAELWAWRLMKNLMLHKFMDPITEAQARKVDDILETLVWRTYHRDGRGGFFPLKRSVDDMTKREIWHQMHAYVNEKLNL